MLRSVLLWGLRGAALFALLSFAFGTSATWYPKYHLGGYDVTWLVGSAGLAGVGAIPGFVAGVSARLAFSLGSRRTPCL